MPISILLRPRALATANLIIGLTSFSFQCLFLASHRWVTNFDYTGAGIWVGLVFIVTAIIAYLDVRFGKSVHAIGPCASCVGAMILYSLSILALNELDEKCPDDSDVAILEPIYHCSLELGIDVLLMLCGLIALPINAFLALTVFGVVNLESLQEQEYN